MRVPLTVRRSSQSILKKINPVYTLEVLMLKLQYFGHLMQRADSLEKNLILEKGMATHSSILAWRISRTEEAGGL